MAKLVFGLMQSLDGYVDHMELGPPGPGVFGHFVEHVRELAGCVYGRRTYEVMRYWDENQSDWDAQDREFAAVWRSLHKWVVSRSLNSVGPNATLIQSDLGTAMGELKARLTGEIDVAGPHLARSLTDLGLIDEYRLYFPPLGARPRRAVFRRAPAASPPGCQRSDRRGHDQVDVRSGLMRLPKRGPLGPSM